MLNSALYSLKTGNFNLYNSPQGLVCYEGYIRWILLFTSLLHYVSLAGNGALRYLNDLRIFLGDNWIWTISHPSFYLWARSVFSIIGTSSILVLYLIVSNLFNKKVALIAAFILGTMPFFCMYSHILTPYIPLILVMLLSILFILKYVDNPKWATLFFAGVFIALSASMRMNMFLLIIPASAAIFLSKADKKLQKVSVLVLISVLVDVIVNFHYLISFNKFVNALGRLSYITSVGEAGALAGVPGLPQFIHYFNAFLGWFNSTIFGIPSYWFVLAAIPSLFIKKDFKKNILVFGSFILFFYPYIGMKYNPTRGVLFLAPFIAILISLGLYNSGKILFVLGNYFKKKILFIHNQKMRMGIKSLVIILLLVALVQPVRLAQTIKDKYIFMTTYKESRTQSFVWLADQIEPHEKICVVRELKIHGYDMRLIELKQIYDRVQQDRFKRLRQKDLIYHIDYDVLKKLQRSPDFVYKEADLVLLFVERNKLKIRMPEVIEEDVENITFEWLIDNKFDYLVGYEDIRNWYKSGEERSPLTDINPIKSFGKNILFGDIFTGDPRVNIYRIDSSPNR
ncbi:glycosyltransferase family 39 protein [Acidobacteriota bacterium]